MFKSDELKKHFDTADVVRSVPKVIGEINLNDLERIKDIGNYTNSLTAAASSVYPAPDSLMRATVSYDISTLSPRADADSSAQIEFHNTDDNLARLYPLQDCFGANRPRSGINKAMYFPGRKLNDIPSARRPRYYVSSPKDKFKYWTSFRKEGDIEKGISKYVSRSIQDTNLATNPSFEATSGIVEVRRNLMPDPRAITLTYWNDQRWFGGDSSSGTHTAISNVSDGPVLSNGVQINTYTRKQWDVAPLQNGDTGLNVSIPGKFTTSPGASIAISGYIRANSSGVKNVYVKFIGGILWEFL